MNSTITNDSMLNMTMPTSITSTGPMATAMTNSSMPSMSSAMGGMDMSCKISMLWNWYTIDSCFIAKSWHIRSTGGFAGACIGAMLLVVCLEFLRRLGREFDAFIVYRAGLRQTYLSGFVTSLTGQAAQTRNTENVSNEGSTSNLKPHSVNSATVVPAASGGLGKNGNTVTEVPYRPSLVEQLIRALLHTMQFAVAYIVMLLAMYYNGYIIICIFIGAFIGCFIFSWEPVTSHNGNDATAVTKCCG